MAKVGIEREVIGNTGSLEECCSADFSNEYSQNRRNMRSDLHFILVLRLFLLNYFISVNENISDPIVFVLSYR